MSLRDDVFQLFGPKLMEAFLSEVLGEINLLRTEQGFPPLVPDEMYTRILNHITEIPNYEWMDENP